MAGFVIRPYRETDRAAVIAAEIDLQEYERTLHDTRLPGGPVMEAYVDRLQQHVAAQSGTILIAEEGGRLLGFVACVVVRDDLVQETPDSNVHGYITDIYVVPDRRRSGLAEVLLRRPRIIWRRPASAASASTCWPPTPWRAGPTRSTASSPTR
jgi:ribosomal protein S18 acetylase RimI-like enzyme